MSLQYCFESSYVSRTLSASKKSDLAVVDTEGRESLVITAVRRGVYVYGYLNVGAGLRYRTKRYGCVMA